MILVLPVLHNNVYACLSFNLWDLLSHKLRQQAIKYSFIKPVLYIYIYISGFIVTFLRKILLDFYHDYVEKDIRLFSKNDKKNICKTLYGITCLMSIHLLYIVYISLNKNFYRKRTFNVFIRISRSC